MLNHKIAVYVPSTINGNLPSNDLAEKWLKITKIRMANLFGGFTTFQTQGGYMSAEHGLIEEQITIVQSFTDDEGLTKLPKVNELAMEIMHDMGQEVVSVEVDGTLNFIGV
jgi:hypothetical protein